MDKIGIKKYIRTIKDFPHEGIMFRDVTTLFSDPTGFELTISEILSSIKSIGIDKVVGIEARGFIIGGALANDQNLKLCSSTSKVDRKSVV